MLLDRRSAPFLAVGVALVLLAGGLVAVGVWWATNCFGGGWDGRWARTCPPPPRGRTGPTSPRRATCATSASTPRCAGVSGSTSTASASRPSRFTGIRSSVRRPSRTGSWSPRSAVPAASRPSRRTRRSSRRTTRRRGRRAGRSRVRGRGASSGCWPWAGGCCWSPSASRRWTSRAAPSPGASTRRARWSPRRRNGSCSRCRTGPRSSPARRAPRCSLPGDRRRWDVGAPRRAITSRSRRSPGSADG